MASNNIPDNQMLTDKENTRKNIRNGLTYKKPYSSPVPDLNTVPVFLPIEKRLEAFVTKFRAAGGKYIPCNTQNLIPRLIQIAEGQQYARFLNTSSNLGQFLVKHQVRHVTAVSPMETVDAALFFSDMLVARTGAIGFTQTVSSYPSARNLARDIIVVSRQRFIFSDMEDALAYQLKRNKNVPNPITEFICPSIPDMVDGKPVFTPKNPRFILMMVEESPVPVQPQQQDNPQIRPDNEPKNEEPSRFIYCDCDFRGGNVCSV